MDSLSLSTRHPFLLNLQWMFRYIQNFATSAQRINHEDISFRKRAVQIQNLAVSNESTAFKIYDILTFNLNTDGYDTSDLINTTKFKRKYNDTQELGDEYIENVFLFYKELISIMFQNADVILSSVLALIQRVSDPTAVEVKQLMGQFIVFQLNVARLFVITEEPANGQSFYAQGAVDPNNKKGRYSDNLHGLGTLPPELRVGIASNLFLNNPLEFAMYAQINKEWRDIISADMDNTKERATKNYFTVLRESTIDLIDVSANSYQELCYIIKQIILCQSRQNDRMVVDNDTSQSLSLYQLASFFEKLKKYIQTHMQIKNYTFRSDVVFDYDISTITLAPPAIDLDTVHYLKIRHSDKSPLFFCVPNWIGNNLKTLKSASIILPESELVRCVNVTPTKLEWVIKIMPLPASFGKLIHLTQLILIGCNWKVFPEIVTALKELVLLQFTYNEFTSLPESFGNLVKLQDLNLSHNRLSTLPQSFNALQKLTDLGLSYNEFQIFPEIVTALPFMSKIYANCNKLSELPASLQNLTQLNVLHLENNQFKEFPEVVTKLKDLRMLLFAGNNIRSIPSSIQNMIQLRHVDFSKNGMTEFPTALTLLPMLDYINLGSNEIEDIPDSIENIERLETLKMGNNNLTTLPLSLQNLEKLITVRLEYNRLLPLGPEWSNRMKNKVLHNADVRKPNPLVNSPV